MINSKGSCGSLPGGQHARVSSLNLRRSVHAIVLDEENRVLLCRFAIPGSAGAGFVNDYFLVRTVSFVPCGALSGEELAAENIDGLGR